MPSPSSAHSCAATSPRRARHCTSVYTAVGECLGAPVVDYSRNVRREAPIYSATPNVIYFLRKCEIRFAYEIFGFAECEIFSFSLENENVWRRIEIREQPWRKANAFGTVYGNTPHAACGAIAGF